MKLYHGSNTVVDRPDVARSRDRLDFGRGFYPVSNHSPSWIGL
ncbi:MULTISPECIES: DUF3990 domain-containing protein [Adlercreutzia]|nr:DUF3990 domain-containing protein [Adlercreutzia equolifaciens]